MRFIPKKTSIEEEGLETYLERTKSEHNGFGFERFAEMLTDPKDFTKHQMAVEFGVDRATIYRWLDVYNKGGVDDTSN